MLVRFIGTYAADGCTGFYLCSVKYRFCRRRHCDDQICIFDTVIRILGRYDCCTVFSQFLLHFFGKCFASFFIQVKNLYFFQLSCCEHCLKLSCCLSPCTDHCTFFTFLFSKQIECCTGRSPRTKLCHISSIQHRDHISRLSVDQHGLRR